MDDARFSAEVWLGDVIEAWALHRDLPRDLVAGILGFNLVGGAPVETPGGEKTATMGPAWLDTGNVSSNRSFPTLAREPSTPLATEVVDSSQTPGAVTMPHWMAQEGGQPVEAPAHIAAPLPHQPLLVPGWTRAILAAACAAELEGVEPDLSVLVEVLASAAPISRLPMQRLRSLRHGVQLLVDHGEGLAPYQRDTSDLIGHLLAVCGRERTTVLRFADCPSRGVESDASALPVPYQPPLAPTPVVVVSDLGMARGSHTRDGATTREWLQFALLVRRSGCALIVFAPYPLRRWPQALRSRLRAVSWDRATSLTGAGRVVDRGLV